MVANEGSLVLALHYGTCGAAASIELRCSSIKQALVNNLFPCLNSEMVVQRIDFRGFSEVGGNSELFRVYEVQTFIALISSPRN